MEIVEVRGPDGSVHRFAGGTRAGFAVERINARCRDRRRGRAVFIEATRHGGDQEQQEQEVKEEEEEEEFTVAFGPDVELHAHHGWIFRTAMETRADGLPDGNPKQMEPVDLRTLFPGGKIPRGRDVEYTFEYISKVVLCFVFMLVLGVAFKTFLEQLPAICDALLKQLPYISHHFNLITNDTREL